MWFNLTVNNRTLQEHIRNDLIFSCNTLINLFIYIKRLLVINFILIVKVKVKFELIICLGRLHYKTYFAKHDCVDGMRWGFRITFQWWEKSEV